MRHAQKKFSFANGIHPDRVTLGFASDVMGEEGTPVNTAGEGFYALRVAAGIKPYCLLNASHQTTARLWNSCLYIGYLMGCNTEKGWQDEQKYLPVIIKLNEAGWQTVTFALANPPPVGIERWGGQEASDPLLFSVMDRSEKAVEAELNLDLRALRRTTTQKVTMLPENVSIDAERGSDGLVLRLKLAPEQAAALRLGPL